jgi:hypothetical protein
LGLVAVARVEEAALETELTRPAAALLMEAMAEVMLDRSEPVAVDSSLLNEAISEPALPVMLAMSELAAELIELSTVAEWVESELALDDDDEAADERDEATDAKLALADDVSTLLRLVLVLCWACHTREIVSFGETKAGPI